MTRSSSGAGRRPATPRLGIAVLIEAAPWRRRRGIAALTRRAAGAAAEAAALRGAAELCVVLTDDRAMRSLNRTWRGKDKPTNVLSFPAGDVQPIARRPKAAPRLLGDVVVAFGVTAAEAAAQNKTLAAHLTHLVVHGVLHLLGYDHETAADAKVMEGLEIRVLSRLGIADPYRTNDRRAA